MNKSDISVLFWQTVKEQRNFSFIKNKKNSVMHIAYGLDNNAARMAGASIASVCKNNNGANMVFSLLCTDISKGNIDKFAILAQRFDIDINIYFLDMTTTLLKNLATDAIFPLPIWFRIFLPYIFGKDRILYLDTDVICVGEIAELFTLDMHKAIVGVIPDFEPVRLKRTQELKLKDHLYFNSGVMLIDAEKWLGNRITELLLQVINEHKKLLDQDILNLVFSKKPHFYLDEMYNSIGLWCEPDNIIKDRLPQIKLIHFANHPKPWNILWQYEKRPYMENIYKDYEKLSPWKGTPLEMPRIYHHKRWYAEILRNDGKLKEALYWYWQYIRGKYNF
ncbi:glycosyltransferase family 8 protein [Pectinatus haikarae]|uniref:Lipopolysaccharide biosynthesis glycosyltransferase n=1 Tax=Pectinatus haikarae TaxID=349096 RepID=A0ABT9YBT3_9FIRM|nr:glycosyltransferase [Pectinatus haikarae]MDQ0205181.1 lipopolysaccharide biosynthesis glycosyltransferase [Pectinatus haikarae]